MLILKKTESWWLFSENRKPKTENQKRECGMLKKLSLMLRLGLLLLVSVALLSGGLLVHHGEAVGGLWDR